MMQADAKTAKTLFSTSDRYIVPAYQRPYVWEEERQWQPLWDDLAQLADARLEDREELHFLGAIVLRQEKSSPGGISEWSVIDGQQRLTSLQLLFSAMADAARGDDILDEAQRLSRMTLHDEVEATGDDRFRFWPTTINRKAYRSVVQEGGPDPTTADDPDNTIQEAWTFFRDKARAYAALEDDDAGINPHAPDEHLRVRYGALREAAAGMIQVVAIQLESHDPAQVIFETLNARGTPLLATDLIKNALFERAEQAGLDIEEVHEKYWAPELGQHDYWSQDERLGRVTVPRSEAFLMHWLAMKLGEYVPSNTLFDRFRREFLEGPDQVDPIALLTELGADAALVRTFPTMPTDTPAGAFLATARMADITTHQPLVMALLKANLDAEEQAGCFGVLESYIVRRMIARLSTNSYTRQVGDLIKTLSETTSSPSEALISNLLGSQSATSRWPTDEEVRTHLQVQPLYGSLGRWRIVSLLSTIELSRRGKSKTEGITELPKRLQIEHLMPQKWQSHWALPDGANEDAVSDREQHINLLGNLTLVAGGLNASMSNADWATKRAALNEHSILVLNKALQSEETWDEAAIDARGRALTEELLTRWPGPQHFVPEGWKTPDAELNAEAAEMTQEEIVEVFDTATPYIGELLIDLAHHAGERRTYAEIESSLDWPGRRLPGVFGGYTQRYKQFEGRRPFHIHLDADGKWWMWMDDTQSEWVISRSAEKAASSTASIEETRAWVEDDEVRSLIDLLPERVNATPGCSAELSRPAGQPVQLRGPSTNGASGYFAKRWLFLWWTTRFPGDQAWFASRLSKPEQVVVNNNGQLRTHIATVGDVDVVIQALLGEAPGQTP